MNIFAKSERNKYGHCNMNYYNVTKFMKIFARSEWNKSGHCNMKFMKIQYDVLVKML